MQEKQNDFTKNSMAYNIMSLAIPMTIAQLINVLYSLVDRMYIGHLAQNSTLALTGLGITKCERKAPKFIYGDISSLKNNDSISLFFVVLYF